MAYEDVNSARTSTAASFFLSAALNATAIASSVLTRPGDLGIDVHSAYNNSYPSMSTFSTDDGLLVDNINESTVVVGSSSSNLSGIIVNLEDDGFGLGGSGSAVCASYLAPNHYFFQLANFFLFLSYLAPNGVYGILYLRITLAIGSFLFALWGYVVLCALDTFLWNVVFLVINFIHACVIIYHLRPIKFPKNLENLYRQLFLPLRVSRFQFRRVLKCMKEIRTLQSREPFAFEKKTKVDKLSLVLSGRFLVSQDGKPLNYVTANQFLDSPEWFGMSTDEYFQVSVMAVEESTVLVWNRDKLKLTINGDSFLQAVFDHILGKDVVNKLMQVNEQCLTSNGTMLTALDFDCPEKPQYIVQKSDDPDAILGTVTRHIQGASILAWRLGKISEETDYETAV